MLVCAQTISRMTDENLLRGTASREEDLLPGEVEPAVDTLLSRHVFLDHLNFHWCEYIPRKRGKGRKKEGGKKGKEREEGTFSLKENN